MERLWTKSFIQMTIAMLFLFTGFYLLVPTLPLFIKEIGGNESQVGLMMGMFTIAASCNTTDYWRNVRSIW